MRELICGRNSVLDAINNDIEIIVIYTNKPHEIKTNKKIEVKVVNANFLDKLTNENHQGFIAEIKEINYYGLDTIFIDKPNKVLILDHIQDPHNLGAIIRSANAFGIKHIILPKDRAAKLTSGAIKVSSGGYVNMKIIRVNSLIDAITKMKKSDFWIYASSLKEATNINDTIFNYPMAIIVGNEHKGVSNTLLKHSDQNIFIPMQGTIQSLNVSVATALLLFNIK